MGPEFLIMMVVLIGALLLMNVFAKRSQKKRVAERDAMMADAEVPGRWMQTYSGFFGRYVESDGDVIVLETPSGEETYWLKGAIKGPIDPPFEDTFEVDDTAVVGEITEETVEGPGGELDEFEAEFAPSLEADDSDSEGEGK